MSTLVPLQPASTPPPPHCLPIVGKLRKHPLAYVDIYVDDFIVLAQGPPSNRANIRNTVFHTIDQVLRPLQPLDAKFNRKEPISVNKLNKGDALWTTRKIVLGWVIDTHTQTIELPQHRSERLLSILNALCHRRRISFKSWQKQLGEIQSMVLALPGGRGLFSTLYSGYTEG